MKGKKKYNIFWFIIDSVRSYKTGKDDRDRLDIMDKFSKESIEFTNAYTSAPSSLLAAGALFTGLPSVYIARHFNDWKFKSKDISTIKNLVDDYGYTSFPLIDSRNGREKYQYLLPPFKKDVLPKGYKLSDYVWFNEEITDIFEYILTKKEFNEPVAFIFWYDCRRDPKTSYHVERALKLIKKFGYFDNSIIIMTSDHGYPDPSTSLNETFFKNMGHDMVLTNDNIKVPLLIRYPNSPIGLKISNNVGHVDIIPTIFDLLNIPLKQASIKLSGKSLIPIIEGKEKGNNRVIRTDTRLQMDVGKITSLQFHSYKYIYYHDENIEALYNIVDDPKEINNLLEVYDKTYKDKLKFFRSIKKEYDKELIDFHKSELFNNAKRSFSKLNKKYSNKLVKILIISKATSEILVMLSEVVKVIFNYESIELVYAGQDSVNNINVNRIYKVNEINIETIKRLNLNKYNIVIYLTHNSRRVFLKDDVVKAVKNIKANNYLLMNYNFELFDYFSIKSFWSYLKLFFNWEIKGYFYKQEPLYFIKDVSFYVRHTFKILLREKKRKDIMTAREIIYFRNAHLKGEKKGLLPMEDDQMNYEIKRIKDWNN